MPGGHSGEVIPVPIPNTEVKLSYADDTAFWWESRKLPGFFYLIFLSISAWKFPSTYFFYEPVKICSEAKYFHKKPPAMRVRDKSL